MTVDQLGDYLKQHWLSIREQLLNGTYEAKPCFSCLRGQ
jgi:RNA-directed DNA polymerase